MRQAEENMNEKALFLDLDGTLLNDQKQITAKNREAIEAALQQGHHIIIATGRPLVSAAEQAQVLGLTGKGCYLIAFNGCVLYDIAKKEIIFHSVLPMDLVYEIFDEAHRRGLHIQTYDETSVLVEPGCADPDVEEYCRRSHMNYKILPNIRTLQRAPEKVLLIHFGTQEPLEQFRHWASEFAPGKLDSYYSCDEYLEIVNKGINKGNAIRRMAELLNIPIENTVAARDAANDIPMIQAAHMGVAMKNAASEVRTAADYITEHDNNHDGIAEIIEKFLL